MIDRIRRMVEKLDAAVPKAGAQARMTQYGGGKDESKIVATQEGYLRLGIEFLHAGLAETSLEHPTQVLVDLDYLMTADTDIGFGGCERVEEMSAPPPSRVSFWDRLKDYLFLGGCVCFLLLVMVGSGAGLFTVLGWFAHR